MAGDVYFDQSNNFSAFYIYLEAETGKDKAIWSVNSRFSGETRGTTLVVSLWSDLKNKTRQKYSYTCPPFKKNLVFVRDLQFPRFKST